MKKQILVIVFTLYCIINALAQHNTKEHNYGKLLFNSNPTIPMIVDLGNGEFVIPIVTNKKQAFLDCYTYDLNQVYSEPFKRSTKTKKDMMPPLTSYDKESKTLYSIRQDKSGRSYFIEYLKIDPETGKTTDQKLLSENELAPNNYYFSENKSYFLTIPLLSMDGRYTYSLYTSNGTKLSENTVVMRDPTDLSSMFNIVSVSNNGIVTIARKTKRNKYSVDVFDSNGQNISSNPLEIDSKFSTVIDFTIIPADNDNAIISVMTGNKKEYELMNWLVDNNNKSVSMINTIEVGKETIGKYMSELDPSQILSVKKVEITKKLKDLRIVSSLYEDNHIVNILEAYQFSQAFFPSDVTNVGISNDTYVVCTNLNGELKWVFALPRKVVQGLSKYKQFGAMGETVKAKASILDGKLKLITTEDFSKGDYGYDVLREIDLHTGEISSPIRLQRKDNVLYDFSFVDYYNWINPDEIILMTAKWFEFKLVKIKIDR